MFESFGPIKPEDDRAAEEDRPLEGSGAGGGRPDGPRGFRSRRSPEGCRDRSVSGGITEDDVTLLSYLSTLTFTNTSWTFRLFWR